MHTLWNQKIKLLDKLKTQLQTQEMLLERGDADHAVEWERENQKIIQKLIHVDGKLKEADEKDGLIFRSAEIQTSGLVYRLLEETRDIQFRVQKLMESAAETARAELNEVSVKRQLKVFFRDKELGEWNKRIC
jgi:hypothetical protein